MKSLRIRSYFGPHFFRIFPHSDRIQRDTPYLSVFSSNAGKCGKNADQNNSEYGLFLHSGNRRDGIKCGGHRNSTHKKTTRHNHWPTHKSYEKFWRSMYKSKKLISRIKLNKSVYIANCIDRFCWQYAVIVCNSNLEILFAFVLILLTLTSYLTLSWRRLLSYRNQSTELRSKSMDWFLYDNGLRHERVK